jgi:hypothetical protein
MNSATALMTSHPTQGLPPPAHFYDHTDGPPPAAAAEDTPHSNPNPDEGAPTVPVGGDAADAAPVPTADADAGGDAPAAE